METRRILLTITAVLLVVTSRSQPVEPEKLSFGFSAIYESARNFPKKKEDPGHYPEYFEKYGTYSSNGAYSFGVNIEYLFNDIYGVRTGFLVRSLNYKYKIQGLLIADQNPQQWRYSEASYYYYTVYGEIPLAISIYKNVKSSSFGMGFTISYLFLMEQEQSGSLRYTDDHTPHPLSDQYGSLEIETDERKASFSLHINYTYRIHSHFKLLLEPSLRLMKGTGALPITGETINPAFLGVKIGIYYIL